MGRGYLCRGLPQHGWDGSGSARCWRQGHPVRFYGSMAEEKGMGTSKLTAPSRVGFLDRCRRADPGRWSGRDCQCDPAEQRRQWLLDQPTILVSRETVEPRLLSELEFATFSASAWKIRTAHGGGYGWKRYGGT